MFGKKNTSPQVEQAVAKSVNFELSVAQMVRRSERRAWIVAWSAILMALLLAAGYFLFLPLKEKVPYLVIADPYTGTASVARLVGDFRDRQVTTEEAINKSNVAQFVTARESYDSGLIGQRNWRTVLSMATPAVSPAYVSLHSEGNPNRPFKLYGSSKSVRVQLLSIVLIGGGNGRVPTGATVRFQRSIYDKERGVSDPLDNKVATLEFTYNKELRLDEEDSLLNPLRFRVTNYRVDDDYTAAPPRIRPEFPALPLASQTSAAPVSTADPASLTQPQGALPVASGPAALEAQTQPQTDNPANGARAQ